MAVALLLLCLTGSLAYGQAFVGSTEELTTIKDASSDRLDHMLDSKGNKVQFTYDSSERVKKVTYLETTIECEYDAEDRMHKITKTKGSGEAATVTEYTGQMLDLLLGEGCLDWDPDEAGLSPCNPLIFVE